MDLFTPVEAPTPRPKTPVKPVDKRPAKPTPPKKPPTMRPDSLERSSRPVEPPKPPEVPLRTVDELVAGARKVYLVPQAPDKSATADTWRTIQEKSWSVKLYREKNIWYNGDYTAESERRTNATTVAKALEALNPEQQAQYKALTDAIADLNSSPKLALEELLVTGRLTKADAQGKSVLDGLNGLLAQPLAEKLDRGVLLAGLIEELAWPVTIQQQNSGTCTVTSLQIKTAIEQPTEYLRLVSGLASPEGKVKLANGEDLTRAPGTEAHEEIVRGGQTVEDGRTLSSRLWQSAMMDFGDGAELSYNVRLDRHEGARDDGKSGLIDSQIAKVWSAVTGDRYEAVSTRYDLKPEELYQKLAERTAARERVPVTFKWASAESSSAETGFHMVLVSKVDDTGIQIENPWGERNFIAREQALEILSGAHLRRPSSQSERR